MYVQQTIASHHPRNKSKTSEVPTPGLALPDMLISVIEPRVDLATPRYAAEVIRCFRCVDVVENVLQTVFPGPSEDQQKHLSGKLVIRQRNSDMIQNRRG